MSNLYKTGQKIKGLKGKLFPYQQEGVAFLDKKKGRALIADEMGLGKTVQALAFAQLHPELRPILILCPASVKWNWKKEIRMWMSTKRKSIVLKGRRPRRKKADVYIINYDVLPYWKKSLKEKGIKLCILDECHYIKNTKAKRSKSTRSLCRKIPKRIALSGTPIINRPFEFYNTLRLIRPKLFPSFWDFVNRYCGARYTRYGWDFSGATNSKKLNKILRRKIMIRRLKKNVLTQLPKKIRSIVPLEINNKKEYDLLLNDFPAWLRKYRPEKYKKAMKARSLSKIEYLKQVSVEGKMDQTLEWIDDFIQSGQKLVVLASHRKALKIIYKKFKSVSVLATNPSTRQKVIEKFQNDKEVKLFLCITKVAVGFNLTAASNVAIIEFGWNPAEMDQGEDRTHRIGQKRQVTIWYLVGKDTIDEDIINLIDKKRRVLERVLEGSVQKDISIVSDLIKMYKKRERRYGKAA